MDMDHMTMLLRTIVSEELKAKLKPIQDELGEVKKTVREMKETIGEMSQTVVGMKDQLDRLATKQSYDKLAMLQIINGKLDNIRKDVEFTYMKSSMNELEINRLKTQ